jgi:hypothetical protein
MAIAKMINPVLMEGMYLWSSGESFEAVVHAAVYEKPGNIIRTAKTVANLLQ